MAVPHSSRPSSGHRTKVGAGLTAAACSVLLGFGSLSASAAEVLEPVTLPNPPSVSEPKHSAGAEALTAETPKTETSKRARASVSSGVDGTVSWDIDAQGVLTFGAGVFGEPGPYREWREDLEGITKIRFPDSQPTFLQKDSNQLFSDMVNLQSIEGDRKINTSNTTDMSWLFRNASSLSELDVSQWDTSNVISMYETFYDASSLTALDVSNWSTSNVANLGWIFAGATSLESVDVSR